MGDLLRAAFDIVTILGGPLLNDTTVLSDAI